VALIEAQIWVEFLSWGQGKRGKSLSELGVNKKSFFF